MSFQLTSSLLHDIIYCFELIHNLLLDFFALTISVIIYFVSIFSFTLAELFSSYVLDKYVVCTELVNILGFTYVISIHYSLHAWPIRGGIFKNPCLPEAHVNANWIPKIRSFQCFELCFDRTVIFWVSLSVNPLDVKFINL